MNRDSARKLSDSDFWQICHEMHPTTNYTFPAPPKLGVSNGNNKSANESDFQTEFDERSASGAKQTNGCDRNETESEEASSSDDSLQNLYVKKTRAHRKFLTAHSNAVNTKKIYETIDLFAKDDDDDDDDDEDVEQNDLEKCKNENNVNLKQLPSSNQLLLDAPMECDEHRNENGSAMKKNENGSINNTDDLLLRIADGVQQLKMNVNQMHELNSKCKNRGTLNAFDDGGDLIDFSDDWMNGESVARQHQYSDKPTKKATHSRVQGKNLSAYSVFFSFFFPFPQFHLTCLFSMHFYH